MRIACWIPKATNTHSQYVILIAFPLQQWLHERASVLRYTGCPTRYQTRHFFNNSNTNEDIATKFEQEYVRCVRNEEECVCNVCLFRCNIFIGFRIIKEMPGLVGSGTPFTYISCIVTYTNNPTE